MCQLIVTYLHMSAFCIVCLLPLANVPAQHMQRMNAFTLARGDKMAMRPFAKLVWSLVFCYCL